MEAHRKPTPDPQGDCDHPLGLVLDDEYRGLVNRSGIAEIAQQFRTDAVEIGGKYEQYLDAPDEFIIQDQVSFFRFCPKCGAELDIPDSWRRKPLVR